MSVSCKTIRAGQCQILYFLLWVRTVVVACYVGFEVVFEIAFSTLISFDIEVQRIVMIFES